MRIQTLTIDRYLGQIKESLVGEKVAQKNALIVSDIISSGTFVAEIAKRLEEEDANVLAILCICDLRKKAQKTLFNPNIPVVSLFDYPIERFNNPNKTPIFEVNPISLRPTIPEDERIRNKVDSLLSIEEFVEWVNLSNSLVPMFAMFVIFRKKDK